MYEMWKRKQTHKDARKMYRRRRYLGGGDLVRRMDRQGEVLIWRRKCSGFARQRMGPKLMKCCRPEQMGTKEFGKMLKLIQTLEGRVPAKKAKDWRIDEKKKIISRQEHQRLVNKFEMEGLMAQKVLWNLAKEKIMKERGESCQMKKVILQENTALCTRKSFGATGLGKMRERSRSKDGKSGEE